MISLIFLFLHLAFAICILYLTVAFLTGAPYVPSTGAVAKTMIELALIRPGMRVYDLGSGDGKLLLLAARQGADATGFEINPFLVALTSFRMFMSRDRKHMRVKWKNFWTADFHDADVVFIYLLPWKMETLQTLLERQLKPGALIVSNSFIFPNWKPIRQDKLRHVYVFRR